MLIYLPLVYSGTKFHIHNNHNQYWFVEVWVGETFLKLEGHKSKRWKKLSELVERFRRSKRLLAPYFNNYICLRLCYIKIPLKIYPNFLDICLPMILERTIYFEGTESCKIIDNNWNYVSHTIHLINFVLKQFWIKESYDWRFATSFLL